MLYISTYNHSLDEICNGIRRQNSFMRCILQINLLKNLRIIRDRETVDTTKNYM
jgi:hypothetical protein